MIFACLLGRLLQILPLPKWRRVSQRYISEREGRVNIAIKQKPEIAIELRDFFADINPAFHMNKTHWNDVLLGGDVADEQVCKMVEQSYDLIKPKR